MLPVGQLEEIYDRVVREEIIVAGEAPNSSFTVSCCGRLRRLARVLPCGRPACGMACRAVRLPCVYVLWA